MRFKCVFGHGCYFMLINLLTPTCPIPVLFDIQKLYVFVCCSYDCKQNVEEGEDAC